MKYANKNSLFAEQAHRNKVNVLNPLDNFDKLIDWQALSNKIEGESLSKEPQAVKRGGRPPYQTEVMLRVLFLKYFHNLSYEQTEFLLVDRGTFKRFARLEHSESTPDHATIWVFEQRLGEVGAKSLLEVFHQQINGHGYIARCGQIVDATLVEAPIQHFSKTEKSALAAKQKLDWTDRKMVQKDTAASWTKKHSKSYYGYKASVNVDVKHKFIRKLVTSTAKDNDCLHLEALLDKSNTSADVYADKGYPSDKHTKLLKELGFRNHIQRKGSKGKPLSECQEGRNARIAKIRVRVEHVFAAMKQMGGKKVVRTIGLARASFGIHMMALCYNIKRLTYMLANGVDGYLRPKTKIKAKMG